MPLEERLRHTVVIERATKGARNEQGIPAETWAALATVKGWLQPRRRRELVEPSSGGAVVGDYRLWLMPTDITEADRVVVSGTDLGRYDGTYSIEGIVDPAGKGQHLELGVDRVAVL